MDTGLLSAAASWIPENLTGQNTLKNSPDYALRMKAITALPIREIWPRRGVHHKGYGAAHEGLWLGPVAPERLYLKSGTREPAHKDEEAL